MSKLPASDEENEDFLEGFRKLGGNPSYENSRFEAEHVMPFMIGQCGPFVCAADYLLLLRRYREVICPKEVV